MIDDKDLENNIFKNTSYLFTIGLYSFTLTDKIQSCIINTYLYTDITNIEESDTLYVLLEPDTFSLIEEMKCKILGYKTHFKYRSFVIMKCQLSSYLYEDELHCIMTSQYSKLKDTALYRDFLKQQGAPYTEEGIGLSKDLQRQIILNTESLQATWKKYLEVDVNAAWKLFNKEKEILSLSKIINMETQLQINKDWLLSKIENSDVILRVAYKDVLANSKELEVAAISTDSSKDYYEVLFEKLKEKLKETCGKTQYQLEIKGVKYPFMPNLIDFKSKLSKVIDKYQLKDSKKVEKCLLKFVSNLGPGILKYYIDKNNTSTLASDYENFEEEEVKIKTTFEL